MSVFWGYANIFFWGVMPLRPQVQVLVRVLEQFSRCYWGRGKRGQQPSWGGGRGVVRGGWAGRERGRHQSLEVGHGLQHQGALGGGHPAQAAQHTLQGWEAGLRPGLGLGRGRVPDQQQVRGLQARAERGEDGGQGEQRGREAGQGLVRVGEVQQGERLGARHLGVPGQLQL